MTKKRFENRLNKENIKFATLNPVWDNERGTALNVFEMIGEMNELHDENQELQGKYDAQKQLFCQLNSDKNNIWQDYQDLKKENEQLKSELQKIYEIATVLKVRNIVEEVYDDLLYETSDESDHARKNVLKCLEKIDLLRDDLE